MICRVTEPCSVLLAFLSCVAVCLAGKEHVNFGYSGPHGPAHWAEDYESCLGKHQSPINIEEHDVRDVSFPALVFSDLNLPRKILMINNGHTALLHASNDSKPAHMAGGPLNGTYVFEQLHFHWGENDREGSEDLINNHSFAMELHAVFYKNAYGSMNQATNYPDGLAVLAFFFEIPATRDAAVVILLNMQTRLQHPWWPGSVPKQFIAFFSESNQMANIDAKDEANPTFNPIVTSLAKIERVGSEIPLPGIMNLGQLLDPEGPSGKDRKQNYYTYNGSLTTPPCSEVVTWIDFKDPLYLSHSQIAAFRDISSSEGHKLTHNFRPVQPLDGRPVLRNIPQNNSAIRSAPSSLIFAVASLTAVWHLLHLASCNPR